MAYELVYTSAERGLRPGTRGFCTVAYTRGMPPQHVQLLEALSAYKNVYAPHEENIAQEPVSWSHYRSNLTGRNTSILSRVAALAADHTRRSNKLAHHVLIHEREHCAGGPVWLSTQEGFFLNSWNEAPHHFESPKAIPAGDSEDCHAQAWEELTGDAGNAARLAMGFRLDPQAIQLIVFEPGMDMLSLLGESLALLPRRERWQITYNSYFTSLPAGASCSWRCCLPDSEILRDARRNPRAQIIDLTAPLAAVADDPLVTLAREGGPQPPDENEKDTSKAAAKPRFVTLPTRNINMLTMKPRKPDNF
jgi:hypothetical protein